jgi:uncharacterized damage-inducible protein DinB
MCSPEMLCELYAHLEWADAKVWSVAIQTKEASSDKSLCDTLFHVHQTQRAYLNMWMDKPQQILNAEDFDNLVSLFEWAHPYYAEVRRFLDAANSSPVDRPVPELFRQRMEQHLGRVVKITLGETAHHRGQLNTRLRELTGEPPLVDYIAWVWQGRPVADWNTTSGTQSAELA